MLFKLFDVVWDYIMQKNTKKISTNFLFILKSIKKWNRIIFIQVLWVDVLIGTGEAEVELNTAWLQSVLPTWHILQNFDKHLGTMIEIKFLMLK